MVGRAIVIFITIMMAFLSLVTLIVSFMWGIREIIYWLAS